MKWEIIESKLAELNGRGWVLVADQSLSKHPDEFCVQLLNHKSGHAIRGGYLGKTLGEAVLRAVAGVECFESLGCVPTQEQEDEFWREHYGDADHWDTARTKQFRLLAKNMADQVDVKDWVVKAFTRVAGDAVCEHCKLAWSEHPELHQMATFHLACDGRVVKL